MMSASHEWRVGSVVQGRYRVDAVHEGGGMAVVHRVRHLEWGVDLAVKSPRPELFVTRAHQDAFVAEAETWVSLPPHPHVCTCHYVTVIDGIPRAFAAYLAGGSLRDWIRDGRLYAGGPDVALRRVLDVALQTAWGVQHAHQQRLVHQDLKAANVLMATSDPDQPVQALVTDFGLAGSRPGPPGDSGVPDGTVLTPTGGLTPTHASPEQLRGHLLTRRTDVWSLAVTVLEMLAGGVLWRIGSAAPAVLALLREPDGARHLAVPLPGGLADLLQACLQPDPDTRPRTAAEPAAALAALRADLFGGPVLPPPERVVDGAIELNNRALSLLDLGRPAEALDRLDDALRADPRHVPSAYNAGLLRWRRGELTDVDLLARVEDLRQQAGDPPQTRYLLAQVHLERGDAASALPLLDTLDPGDPDVPDLQVLLASAARPAAPAWTRQVQAPWQVHIPDRMPWQQQVDREVCAVVMPDATAALTGDWAGLVCRWDLRTGERTAALSGHTRKVNALAVSPDGRRAVSASWDRTVRVWDLDALTCLATWPFEPSAEFPDGLSLGDVAFLPDGQHVVVAVRDAKLIIRLADGATVAGVPATGLMSGPVTVSRSGRFLSWVQESGAQVWDLVSGGPAGQLPGSWSAPAAVLVREAHGDAFVQARSGRIVHWEVSTDRTLGELPSRQGTVGGYVELAGNGTVLAIGNGGVEWWHPASGRCLRTFTGTGRAVVAAGTDRDGATLAVVRQRNVAQRHALVVGPSARWQLARVRSTVEVTRAGAQVAQLLERADAASQSDDVPAALILLTRARGVAGHERDPRLLQAWRRLGTRLGRAGLRGGWVERQFDGFEGAHAVEVTPDGTTGLIALGDRIQVWDLDAGRLRHTLAGHDDQVSCLSVAPDGVTAASGDRSGRLRQWQLTTGECLAEVAPPAARYEWSPKALLSACFVAQEGAGPLVYVLYREHLGAWDPATGRLLSTDVQADGFVALHADPGGTVLVGCRRSGGLRVWDGGTGERLRDIEAHSLREGARDVVVSPDGRLAASVTEHGNRWIAVWDLADGSRRCRIDPPVGANAVHFSPGGRFLLSAGPGPSVDVWDVATGRQVGAVGLPVPALTFALSADGFRGLANGIGNRPAVMALDWDLDDASSAVRPSTSA